MDNNELQSLILKDALGLSENSAGCEVVFSLLTVSEGNNGLDVTDVFSRTATQAKLAMFSEGDYITFELNWDSDVNPELRTIWNLLKTYEVKLSQQQRGMADRNLHYIVTVDIYSLNYFTKGYFTAVAPLFWCLTAGGSDSLSNNQIKMFLNDSGFDFTATDEDEIEKDLQDREAQVDRTSNVILSAKTKN